MLLKNKIQLTIFVAPSFELLEFEGIQLCQISYLSKPAKCLTNASMAVTSNHREAFAVLLTTINAAA